MAEVSPIDQQIEYLENKVAGNENLIFEQINGETVPTTKTPEPAVKKPSRYTKTATFAPDEFTYLEAVFEARKQSGLTDDWNHFIRQCIDFAVNGKTLGSATFATPDLAPVFLKDGFVKPKSK